MLWCYSKSEASRPSFHIDLHKPRKRKTKEEELRQTLMIGLWYLCLISIIIIIIINVRCIFKMIVCIVVWFISINMFGCYLLYWSCLTWVSVFRSRGASHLSLVLSANTEERRSGAVGQTATGAVFKCWWWTKSLNDLWAEFMCKNCRLWYSHS